MTKSLTKSKKDKKGGARSYRVEIDAESLAGVGTTEIEHVTMHYCLEVSELAQIGPLRLPGIEANMMLVKMLDFAAENPEITRRWRDAVWDKFRENPKYRAAVEQFERERVEARDALRDRIAAALDADGERPGHGGGLGIGSRML